MYDVLVIYTYNWNSFYYTSFNTKSYGYNELDYYSHLPPNIVWKSYIM